MESESAVVQHVLELELRLLDPRVRRSTAQVDALLDAEFVEFGASGRRWERQEMLDAISTENALEIGASELHGVRLAEDVVLVTYVSGQGSRHARRSSIWRRTGTTWRIYFHQGTLITDAF